jgi:hypothetical protein
MSRVVKYLLLLFIIGTLHFCADGPSPYPMDPKYSSQSGVPTDSLDSFLQMPFTTDTLTSRSPLEERSVVAATLYAANEPVLSNYYLGHPRYRCVWFPGYFSESHGHNAILTIHRDGDRVWLTSKRLNSLPIFEIIKFGKSYYPVITDTILSPDPFDTSHSFLQSELKREIPIMVGADTLLVSRGAGKQKMYTRTKIQDVRTRELTLEEWSTFEALLAKSDFWVARQSPSSHGAFVDPPELWVIEAHLEEKYGVAERVEATGGVDAAGKYLLQLSGYNVTD